MNGPAALAAARAGGARFRLDPGGRLQATGLGHLPPNLTAVIRGQAVWITDALQAETVARSSLPWRRHGPGWLAIIHPDHTGDGTRFLIGRTGRRWWLTRRPLGDQPIVIVARGTLGTVLAAAEARGTTPSEVAS